MSRAAKLKSHDKQAKQLANNTQEIEKRKFSGTSTVTRVDRTEADKMKNGHLNTDQSSAADKFYEYYVGCQMSGQGSELQERVDTSGAKFQIPDRVIHCQNKLAEAARHLGKVDYTLVHKYVCEGKTTVQICADFNYAPTTRQKLYFKRRFKDACSSLSDLWFFKGKKTVHEPDNPKVDFSEYLTRVT